VTQPDAVEALAAALIADLEAVVAQLTAALVDAAESLTEMPAAARAHRLTVLRDDLNALIDQADAIAAARVLGTMQGSYELGAWVTALLAGTTATFTVVDVNAITHLAQDVMDDLLTATAGMRDDVKAVIRELTRDVVRSKLVVGETAVQAGKDLAARLAERGITAVVYADGRRVSLSTYAEMVIRTKTAEAYQEGGFNQGDALDVQWWEVMDGPACGWTSHDDPVKANGRIVPLDTAREHPLSHPNCRRSTTPRPDILTASDARDAGPLAPAAVEAAWDAATRQYMTTGVAASAVAARTSAALDLTAGTIPNTTAGRKFAATLRRHAG
jgi:hypothetical protein